MNDTITVCGIVATEPRYLVTDTGIAISSMRLASPSRRWDRTSSSWTNGTTNWYTVTAFRSLAANVHKSLKKGDRIVVTGRVRIRTWEREGRGGTSVEIDAEGIGHDLAWGISNWIRVPRHSSESTAVPGDAQTVDPRTGEVRGPDGTDHRGGRHSGPVGTEQADGAERADGTEHPIRIGGDESDGAADEELPDPAEAARHTATVLGGDFAPPSAPFSEPDDAAATTGRDAA